ncbi:MAG: DUF3530 family protein [Methylophaga sp.]|uniref:DUF3530 family protein n=1 Tax=Methylophaga sp. TaxID=2024840 RepID=UPI000C0DB81D|nr:DUF3530 family protein [Methylophaga sp.]MBL1459273.1 DUF3530 family protein [Methylophaga sp.]
MRIHLRLFITFLLFLPCMLLQAGALDETNVAKPQILRQDSVTKGYEPLAVDDQNIAAAYLPQTLGISRGAILLLHDINEHIDSAAIGILRRQLPAYGWNTLSIKIIRFTEASEQEPPDTEEGAGAADEANPAEQAETEEPAATEAENTPADNENTEPTDATETAEPAEAEFTAITTAQRLDAALLKLQQEGHENIVLIGQGAGGELALKTLNETAVPVAALIMINTGELAEGTNMTETAIPILEILGSRQQDSIKQAVLQRQIQMKTEQKTNYQLREINGAAHYFVSSSRRLTNLVHGWLYKQFFDEEDAL